MSTTQVLGRTQADVNANAAMGSDSDPTGFNVMITGQIESAQFAGYDNLFCRYTFAHGDDWKVLQGIDYSYSQVAKKSVNSDGSIVWNFPIDVTYKSTNPHGWPRLVVLISSQDFFGRFVIRGYGSVLIPTVPGSYTRHIRTFAPASSTYLQSILGWLTGNYPQFYDSRFIARGEGREVVRVQSAGIVRVKLNVMTRGMSAFGYQTGGATDLPLAIETAGSGTLLSPSATLGRSFGNTGLNLAGTGRLGGLSGSTLSNDTVHANAPIFPKGNVPRGGIATLGVETIRNQQNSPITPVENVSAPLYAGVPTSGVSSEALLAKTVSTDIKTDSGK